MQDLQSYPDFPMHVGTDDARMALSSVLPKPESELVAIPDALGRRLSTSITALVSHPSTTESALDGIACKAKNGTAMARLKVVGESRAGQAYAQVLADGQCVRIYTGAPIPQGAGAICPIEKLVQDGDYVILQQAAATSDVRHEGSDFCSGEELLEQGAVMTPARLALATAMGYAKIPVYKKLRVAVLSTGDELVEAGVPLQKGQVYDSNRAGLRALLQECGCEVVDLGRVPDSLSNLINKLEEAGGADLLLSSGGVSMGKYDFMRDLLIENGKVSFWKIRIKPGAPAMLGIWNNLPVFGLPGNPVSSFVVFTMIVKPVLLGKNPTYIKMQADEDFKAIGNKTTLARVIISGNKVKIYAKQGSGALRSLSEAEALAIIPEGKDIKAGELLDVVLL